MNKLVVVAIIILLAAFSRLIPHLPNFTAVTAIALFAGAQYGKRLEAFLIPIAALLLSDLVLGAFYEGFYWIYIAFVLVVLLGTTIKQNSIPSTFLTTIGASVLFFLISNFGVWLGSGFYSQDFIGLVACYTAAIPFFRNAFLGDLVYVAIIFGAFEIIKRQAPKLA